MKKLEEVQRTAKRIAMHFVSGTPFPKEVPMKHIEELAEAFGSKRGRYEWEVDSLIRKLIELGY